MKFIIDAEHNIQSVVSDSTEVPQGLIVTDAYDSDFYETLIPCYKATYLNIFMMYDADSHSVVRTPLSQRVTFIRNSRAYQLFESMSEFVNSRYNPTRRQSFMALRPIAEASGYTNVVSKIDSITSYVHRDICDYFYNKYNEILAYYAEVLSQETDPFSVDTITWDFNFLSAMDPLIDLENILVEMNMIADYRTPATQAMKSEMIDLQLI